MILRNQQGQRRVSPALYKLLLTAHIIFSGAWLGIVPTQHSTGGKTRLGKITKHGDPVLRTLLTHAARAVLVQVRRRKTMPEDALGGFAWRKAKRSPWNKAVIAVANKLARIIWCVLARNEVYRPITPKPVVKAA